MLGLNFNLAGRSILFSFILSESDRVTVIKIKKKKI